MSSMCNRVFVVNGPYFSYIIDVIFLTTFMKDYCIVVGIVITVTCV